jgi:hypothetical protein
MPPAPISPTTNTVIKNSIEISRSNASVQGFVLGETLPATILEKLAGNKYMLTLKNLQIPATSNIPLNIGEKLIVKVDSLQPQIVLNIIGNKNQNGDAKINENLLQWRANPEALLHVIDKVAGVAKLLESIALPQVISKSDVEKLIKLFDNIIFSPRTKNNPLFLKDFVSKTGLLLESSVQQLLNDQFHGRLEKPLEDNLKASLLKFSAAIGNVLRENQHLDGEITTKLASISAFTDEALQAIEVKQTINSIFQDSDNGLILQVPVALADGFRLADIFITPEGKDEQGKIQFSSCSVALFLDLDILGKIAVNANFRGGSINCIIKCEKEEVKDLIGNNLEELKNSLTGTGYCVGYIDCVREEELRQEREEFLAGQSFFADQLVNFFV